MKKIIIVLILLGLLASPTSILATEDPFSTPNNKFGIHITNEHDLQSASNLVNSSGGDWGWVTIVIREDEMNTGRWQKVFDQMRRLHLIPIVRVATTPENNHWKKANPDNINSWVDFLNSLNWVTENQYVIVLNEPNHAGEWGGTVSPEEYSNYLSVFSRSLKESSDKYFILPAGLDASAPNSATTMDEIVFLQRMLRQNSDLFQYLDGWSSHSYPNPAFSGSELASGRGTIKTYLWELDALRSMGVSKFLPVFITETGWAHSNGDNILGAKTPSTISEKLIYAFNEVWTDEQIVAVTPFILNYNDSLFSSFSWTKPTGEHYDFYNSVRDIPKTSGKPKQTNSGEIKSLIINKKARPNRNIYGMLHVKNTGQSIWNSSNLSIYLDTNPDQEAEILTSPILEPNQSEIIFFKLTAPDSQTSTDYVLNISHNQKIVTTQEISLTLVTSLFHFKPLKFLPFISLFPRQLLIPIRPLISISPAPTLYLP